MFVSDNHHRMFIAGIFYTAKASSAYPVSVEAVADEVAVNAADLVDTDQRDDFYIILVKFIDSVMISNLVLAH